METNKEKVSVFISGNRDLSEKDFITYYLPYLHELISNDNVIFNISDDEGCSEFCQVYLNKVLTDKSRVTIFGMEETPAHYLSEEFLYFGNFTTLEERNAAMTVCSGIDLHIILDGKGTSEVQKNLIRRFTPKYDYMKYLNGGNLNFWGTLLTIEQE